MINLVEKYFHLWRAHSTPGLCNLFSAEVRYIIKNKGIVLSGLDSLRAYWRRNEVRQSSVRTAWLPVLKWKNNMFFIFMADFFDLQESKRNVIFGIARLKLDDDGKISFFSEYYRKLAMTRDAFF